jgi:hypothetical protein
MPRSPSAGAKSRSTIRGQPGPSHWSVTSHPARPVGFGGAEEETRLPAEATLLGAPVTVTGFDYTNEARGVVAICEGSNGTGEVALADLAFRPDTVTAWIHAAYRHYLGLPPFPARPRPDWTWPD